MIFHENRLLADDTHEISYLNFFPKNGKMSQNLSSAAVVIGALRVKSVNKFCSDKYSFVGPVGQLIFERKIVIILLLFN